MWRETGHTSRVEEGQLSRMAHLYVGYKIISNLKSTGDTLFIASSSLLREMQAGERRTNKSGFGGVPYRAEPSRVELIFRLLFFERFLFTFRITEIECRRGGSEQSNRIRIVS